MPFSSICPPQLAFTASVTAQLPDPPPQPVTDLPTLITALIGVPTGGGGECPSRSPVPLPPDSQPGPPQDKGELCAQRVSLGVPGILRPPSPQGDRPCQDPALTPSFPLSTVNLPQWERLSYFPPGGCSPNTATCSRQSQPSASPQGEALVSCENRPVFMSLLFSPLLPGWRGRGRGGGWGTDRRDRDRELS